MDKLVSKIAALGIPGLVLVTAIGATGLAGGAAITTALAALGPGGILGGIATLGIIGLISEGIAQYGVDAIFSAVIKELYRKGETKEEILRKIKKYPISKELKRKLKENIEMKNAYITKVLGGEALDYNEILNEYLEFGKRLKPFIEETSVKVYNDIKADKTVLFEGAQGMLLDIDYGTYPYVTSSNTTAGGVSNGVGIGPNMITNAVGITKAYTTRVGKGPFPTELLDETGEWIREKGHEYGVTTGRSRRCGWLDLVIVKTAVRVSGLTSLAVTKIDTLAGLDTLKVCVGYKFDGKVIDYFPASLEDLAKCEPVYEEFAGWGEEVANARSYDELPENAKKYLERIEEFTETKISIVSVGPKRDQTMRVKDL